MRAQHIKVALVHRNIGRLANGAARMVQPFRHIAQLHEFLEIVQRGIAPPACDIAHEGRPINRGQHQIAAANLDIALWVAGVLGEGFRCSRTQLARQPTRNMHPLAAHIRTRFAPAHQRRFILDKVDADLF